MLPTTTDKKKFYNLMTQLWLHRELVDSLYHCIDQISERTQTNFLQQNSDKTKVIICGPQKKIKVYNSNNNQNVTAY